jgi:hypothetical protein
MTRAERRREHRRARKPLTGGIPPLPGSSGVRARELFIRALETGAEHPYAGMSRDEIRKAEHERRPVPNRAMARRYGIRSGYTRKLHARLAMAAEIRRADRADATKAMQDARKAKREEKAA